MNLCDGHLLVVKFCFLIMCQKSMMNYITLHKALQSHGHTVQYNQTFHVYSAFPAHPTCSKRLMESCSTVFSSCASSGLLNPGPCLGPYSEAKLPTERKQNSLHCLFIVPTNTEKIPVCFSKFYSRKYVKCVLVELKLQGTLVRKERSSLKQNHLKVKMAAGA